MVKYVGFTCNEMVNHKNSNDLCWIVYPFTINGAILISSKMKIYLIGYMASGKTRFGKALSTQTGYPFFDLDELFEERYRITVFDFFEKYKEESFRKIEQELLLETMNYQDAVIATGGGTPCFFNNMEFIKQNGISIYLKLDLLMLVNRLASVKKKRPLLKDKTNEELELFIRAQMAEREIFYQQADYIIEAKKIDMPSILSMLSGKVNQDH